jgi:peptidoglycan/LPS O-acetylase OafA/YrhL
MTSEPAKGNVKSDARIQVLDSFRAIAILSVIAFHILYLGERTTRSVIINVGEPLSNVFSYGWLGVEFFFIISGFVIFMTVQSAATAQDFAMRRFARIWPGYMVSAILIYVAIYAMNYVPYERSGYDFLVAPAMWAPALKAHYISGVYWSLIVEIRFYLTIAILYYGLGARRFRVAWLIFSLLAMASHYISEPIAIHVFSATYLPFFTMGIVFYRLWRRDWDRLDWALLLVALASLPLLWSDRDVATIAIMLAMPVLFWLFARDKLNILAVEPLLFLGRISYSLYLVHFELSLAIIWQLQKRGIPTSFAVIVALATITALATVLTLFVEEPAKRILKDTYNSRVGRRHPNKPKNLTSESNSARQER